MDHRYTKCAYSFCLVFNAGFDVWIVWNHRFRGPSAGNSSVAVEFTSQLVQASLLFPAGSKLPRKSEESKLRCGAGDTAGHSVKVWYPDPPGRSGFGTEFKSFECKVKMLCVRPEFRALCAYVSYS